MRFLLPIILSFLCLGVYPQKGEPIVQVSGKIVDNGNVALPFTHVVNKTSGRGCISDTSGRYSIIVEKGDTLLFSRLDCHKQYYVVPKDTSVAYIIKDVELAKSPIMIGEIKVFPWKDYNDFRKAVLALRLPESDYDRAYRNIAIIKAQIIASENPKEAKKFKQHLRQQLKHTPIVGGDPTAPSFRLLSW